MTRRPRAGAVAPLALLAYAGYASGVNGAVAPLLAASFGVSEAALAVALAGCGLAALGALVFGRHADRFGRRRVALGAAAALPIAAVASAGAGSIVAYAIAQLGVYACTTTLLATSLVIVAEQAEPQRRASAQARAGFAFTVGAVIPLLLCVALAASDPDRWRWLWWAAVAPLPLAPLARRHLAETRCAPDAALLVAPSGAPDRALRRRGLALLAAATCIGAAEVATRTWLFFHALRALALAPPQALLVITAGGAIGLAGFPLGARLAESAGRRRAFLVSSALFAAGSLGYFGVSRVAGDPIWPFAAAFAGLAIGGNAATTAFRSLAIESVPAERRGALSGALAVAGAVGWIVSMLAVAGLAHWFASIGAAVAVLVTTAVPAAVALVSIVPETRGGASEEVPLERAFADAA